MRRRSRASSKLTKARSHKAKTLKAARDSSSLASGQKTGVARLARELKEAREQQVATADVLKVISRSPSDVQPVFDVIAESARRLCGGQFCFVYRFDGQLLHFVAHHSLTPEVLEMNRRAYPAPPSRRSAAARAILERGFVQIPDINADPDYVLGPMAVVGDYRSVVAVPILRDGLAIGSIAVARAEAGLLPDPQIELLKTFADQAAIAIENVRLFSAEQQRTRELGESLQQQTAAANVLRIISSSPGELEPVFNAIVEKAVTLCDATLGNLFLYNGEDFVSAAVHAASPTYAAARRPGLAVRHLHPEIPLNRIRRTKELIHIADVRTEQAYIDRDPTFCELVDSAGARTLLDVPMVKEDVLIGALSIYRRQVQPFTDKQIELLRNFAAQAVIAIENARLLNELRESLQQQTATAEILGFISRSLGDLAPVFETMLANAVQLCQARFGLLYLHEDGALHTVASHNVPPAFADSRKSGPVRPGPGGALGQAIRTKRTAHIADLAATPAYAERDPPAVSAVELGGVRTVIAVPMLKDNEIIGIISIFRQEVRPFTDKQVALLANFAAQAVIAIDNARLLNEQRQSLEQQTATAEVLRVINSSAGTLAPVFEAMLDKAMQLCEAAFGGMWTLEAGRYTAVALRGVPQPYAAFLAETTLVPGPGTAPYRFLHGERFVHNIDLASEEAYRAGDPQRRALVDLGGARTAVQVPLCKDESVLGVITIYRQEVRPFTDKQIALVQNFAAQAVIAIENTRLLNELRQRTV